VRTVACPRCGGPSVFSRENKWRPFCSERCKMIDLGAWATESYRVAAEEQEPPDDDSSSTPPGS
jgi:uncharacterized protein